MKNLLFSTLLLLAVLVISGQGYAQKTKVLEKSTKSQPSWVNAIVPNYVITTASGKSIEAAQQEALIKVKEQIISSVAENIQTTTTYNRQETINNNQSDFKEQMATATKTRAADIPFIKGISMTKVEDFYWEKVRENDAEKYYYHMKYPFSKEQLQQLIREFEEADRAITKQLEDIIMRIETSTSIEDLTQAAKEVEALGAGLIDVDPRKDKAAVAFAKVRQMLKDVAIETVSASLGEIHVTLRIGNRMVTTSRKPITRSNCAKITDTRSVKDEWVILYLYDECYDDPQNKVNVKFTNAYGSGEKDFFFNIKADKVDIFVNNDINLTGGTTTDSLVSGANLYVALTSKYESPFIINKVILNFANEAPVIIDNINAEFAGIGKHDLNVTLNQELNKTIYTSKKYNMVKGTIEYTSKKTGEKSIYKMFNQKITTSW